MTAFNEVDYLYAMIDMNQFLPIQSMLDWLQENYSVDGFDDSEKLIPNSFGHEKFTTEVILPFLKNTYNLEPNETSKLI